VWKRRSLAPQSLLTPARSRREREAIFHATLSQVIAPGFSAASVVMMRLVQTLTELTAALVGVVMLRRAQKDGEAKR
jgi:hypothetical protein